MTTKSPVYGQPSNTAVTYQPKSGLTALGTTQANAYLIPSSQDFSLFGTVGSGTGAQLPLYGVSPGEEYAVANHGANALLVYPPLNGYLGTLAQNAAISVAAGKTCTFFGTGYGTWAYNNGA